MSRTVCPNAWSWRDQWWDEAQASMPSQLLEERQDITLQLSTDNYLAVSIDAVDVKNRPIVTACMFSSSESWEL
jgi:hypothetical protein